MKTLKFSVTFFTYFMYNTIRFLSRLGDRQCSRTQTDYLIRTLEQSSAVHTSFVSLSQHSFNKCIFNSLITENIMLLGGFKSVHLTSTDHGSEGVTKRAAEPEDDAEPHTPSSSPRAFRHCWELCTSRFSRLRKFMSL